MADSGFLGYGVCPDGQMWCNSCERCFWPDDMATDNDGNYTVGLCQRCFMRPIEEQEAEEELDLTQDMEDMLASFGWTASEEFWRKYDSDAWVFNLANALRKTWRLLQKVEGR